MKTIETPDLIERWRVTGRLANGQEEVIAEYDDVHGAQRDMDSASSNGKYVDVSIRQLEKKPTKKELKVKIEEQAAPAPTIDDKESKRIQRVFDRVIIFAFDDIDRLARTMRSARSLFYEKGMERIAHRIIASHANPHGFDPCGWEDKTDEATILKDFELAKSYVRQQFPGIHRVDVNRLSMDSLSAKVYTLLMVLDGEQVSLGRRNDGSINAIETDEYNQTIREEERDRAMKEFDLAIDDRLQEKTETLENEHQYAKACLGTVMKFIAKEKP